MDEVFLVPTVRPSRNTVIRSETREDNRFNCYIYLGHIHVFWKDWRKAEDLYRKALRMKPSGDVRDRLDQALVLVRSEVDKDAAEAIGLPPE